MPLNSFYLVKRDKLKKARVLIRFHKNITLIGVGFSTNYDKMLVILNNLLYNK